MSLARRLLSPGILVVFALAFYWEIGFGGRVPLSFDPLGYFVPHLTHLGDALREPRVPLWDPYLFGGAPFLANSQTGVLYPPNWIVALFSAPRAFCWLVIGHAALGAVAAYVFARQVLRLGEIGALATGLVFEFGGWTVGQAGHLNQFEAVAWLPLLLLIFDRLLRAPTVRCSLLGGLLLTLQFLAGHTQTLYMSAWTLALYAGWFLLGRLLAAWRSAESGRQLPAWLMGRAAAFIIVGLVTVGLSAPQLLPTLELSDLSIRAGGLNYNLAASFSLQPYSVLEGLLPTYAEPPINGEWLGYVGVTGLLLASTALALRLDRRVVGMLLVALLAVALAFGQSSPVYGLAYRHIPGVGLFRVPARWLYLYTAALAGLVGIGLDSLATGCAYDTMALPGRLRLSPAARVLAVASGLVASLAAVVVYRRVAPAGHPMAIPGAMTVELWLATALVWVALTVVALGRSRAAARAAPALLLALLAAEVFGASLSLGTDQTGPDLAATGLTPEVSLLLSEQRAEPQAPFRLLGVGDGDYQLVDQDRVTVSLPETMSPDEIQAYVGLIRNREKQTPNIPLTFGLSTIDGYDGGVLPLQRYLGLKSLFPEEGNNVIDGRLYLQLRTAPDPKLVGWLGVRYLIMGRESEAEKQWPEYRLAYAGDTKVYENLAVLPRAYVVGQIRAVADDRAALAALRSADFDPRAEAVVTVGTLQAAGVRPESGRSAEARMVSYSEERVVVEADLAAPGLLVLSDTNYPGWRAFVDGVERPIMTTNYLFRGVWLDGGKHRVEYRFEPASFSRGLLIAALTALLSLALLVLGPRLERQVARLAR